MFPFGKATTVSLFTLPNELLSQICNEAVERHPEAGYVTKSDAIAALSSTSRKMRAIAAPHMYSEAAISSEQQLHAFATLPAEQLSHVKEFDVFMDVDLFRSFKLAYGVGKPQWRSPFTSLGAILSQTTKLSALRIRVAHSTGPDSVWTQSSLIRADGIPISPPMAHSLAHTKLPNLRTLELDGFSDIAGLLRVAPNVERLSVQQTNGFAQFSNVAFVEALKHAPKLKELHYSAESLRVSSSTEAEFEQEAELMAVESSEADESAELVKLIALAAPKLETLDLQRRWYGDDEIAFPVSEETISSKALLDAIAPLSNLTDLSLPTSLFSLKDYDALRKVSSIGEERHMALDAVAIEEKEFIGVAASNAQSLRSISFVRPSSNEASAADENIRYDALIIPSSSIVVGSQRNGIRVERPGRIEVSQPRSFGAVDGQIDALPRALPSLAAWERAISYAMENNLPALFAAGAGGMLLSEVVRLIHA